MFKPCPSSAGQIGRKERLIAGKFGEFAGFDVVERVLFDGGCERLCSPCHPPLRKTAMMNSIAPRFRLIALLAAGLVFSLGVIGGLLVGDITQRHAELPALEIPLHAFGSHGSDTMAATTGPIDDSTEGLYTLDFLTGDLICAVPNGKLATPNAGFMGLFKYNVIADLGVERTKKPTFLLVAGQVNYTGTSGTVRPAQSMVYVIDANTGKFAAYAVPWNSVKYNARKMQQGSMVLMAKGIARSIDIRE